MTALVGKRVRTVQPQPWQAQLIDWDNEITRDMVLCLSHADQAYGYAANSTGTIISTAAYTNGGQFNTPAGTAARAASNVLYAAPCGLTGTSYSLFAFGAATSAAVIQSALDMDNGTTRYWQFRLANGKADFIPFNTSAANTGQATSPVAMTVAEMSRGFTMGATASSTRTAVFQNGKVTAATPTNLIAVGTTFPVAVGARQTGTQPWATGGLMLVAMWNRTLTDAEMQSLADNPWQLFKPAPRRLWLAYSASSGTDTPVNPGAGALTLTGYAPTIAQTITTNVTPGVGSLTLTGYAPSVSQSVVTNVVPQAGALTLTGFAPSVTRTANVSVSPGAGSLALIGYAPTVTRTANQSVQPGAGALTLTGYAPLISQGVDNAPRVNLVTIMRITTTNRTVDLGAAVNKTATLNHAGPNLATIMSAAATNCTAVLGPVSINLTAGFP